MQRQLEGFYGLEAGPDVVEFVREGEQNSRETLLLRESAGALEMALVLPPESASLDAAAFDSASFNSAGLKSTGLEGRGSSECADLWLQVLEGVSHFVYVAERARTGLPATQLELELQAEVDKFVLSALTAEQPRELEFRSLHRSLYSCVEFLHPEGTELGQRYRLANALAARFVARLLSSARKAAMRPLLCRFYRSGQTDKIHLARAA